MAVICDDIHSYIGTFTHRYCWEIMRTNNVQYTEQSRSWGNFTELQTLSSNNSNGIVQRCLIKGIEQLFAALATRKHSWLRRKDRTAYRASRFRYIVRVLRIGKNISHCLPPSISCFYLFIFFFFKNGNDSISLSIRNIIFFKAFVEGFYIRMREISILLRGIDSSFD